MIRLSRSEDYAVILVNTLAKQYQKRLVPLSEVAKEYHISLLFLRNLANELRRAGIITAIEGKNGGYALNRPPEEIKIGDILQVFSKHNLVECCSIGTDHSGVCDRVTICSAGVIWRKLNNEFIEKIAGLNLVEFANYK